VVAYIFIYFTLNIVKKRIIRKDLVAIKFLTIGTGGNHGDTVFYEDDKARRFLKGEY